MTILDQSLLDLGLLFYSFSLSYPFTTRILLILDESFSSRITKKRHQAVFVMISNIVMD